MDVHVDLMRARGRSRQPDAPRSQHIARLLAEGADTRTVITVVAIIGSTEESAVDPLHDITCSCATNSERSRIHHSCGCGLGRVFRLDPARARGLRLSSGAPAHPHPARSLAPIPETPMDDYVVRQYLVLGEPDSITVDPHKAGYTPYPAGGLATAMQYAQPCVAEVAGGFPLRRTRRSAYMESKAASREPRPRLSTCPISIWPTRQGYGHLLEQCIFSKEAYARLRRWRAGGPFVSPLFSAFRPRRTAFPRRDRTAVAAHSRLVVDKPNTEIVEGRTRFLQAASGAIKPS